VGATGQAARLALLRAGWRQPQGRAACEERRDVSGDSVWAQTGRCWFWKISALCVSWGVRRRRPSWCFAKELSRRCWRGGGPVGATGPAARLALLQAGWREPQGRAGGKERRDVGSDSVWAQTGRCWFGEISALCVSWGVRRRRRHSWCFEKGRIDCAGIKEELWVQEGDLQDSALCVSWGVCRRHPSWRFCSGTAQVARKTSSASSQLAQETGPVRR